MNGHDTAKVRAAIKEEIRFHGDEDDPARIGAVVEDVVAGHGNPTAVMETFAQMFRDGEVYEAKPAHVRITSEGGR